MLNVTSMQETIQDAPQKPGEQQLNRACEACRLLKVRCLPDSSSAQATCQRCRKSARMCIYAAPQKRRQRVRTDTRVAELEREIRAMRSLLTGSDDKILESTQEEKEALPLNLSKETQSNLDADRSTTSSIGGESSSVERENLSRQSSVPTSHAATPDDAIQTAIPPKLESGEAREFGLLSRETSNRLFQSYSDNLAEHYPGVTFPKNTTPEDIRKSKPILFQAVVTAAACEMESEIFDSLFKEVTQIYADRIFMRGEKSLELVQSLIVSSVWYCPPGISCGPSNLRFYQYIHMAATMALDLGIGIDVDKSVVSLDECRTLLSCYLNCAGVAMRMRRPNMLQWTSGMATCLEIIESSPTITLLDRRLAAWVRLQNVADEWSGSIGPLDSKVQLTLKGYERQLERWREDIDPAVFNVSLVLAYHQDSLYLHESVLEGGSTILLDFNHEHFNPPSEAKVAHFKQQMQAPLSPAYLNAAMGCINSSHALLDEFLKLDIQTLRVVPIIVHVRASYAMVVLVKLFISATSPYSELGKVLDQQILRVDFYIQALLNHLTEAMGPGKLRVPQKWLTITQQVKEWYDKHLKFLVRQGKLVIEKQANKTLVGSGRSDVATDQDIIDTTNQPLWKVHSFPTVATLQKHTFLATGSGDNSAPKEQGESGVLPSETDWSLSSDPTMAVSRSFDIMSAPAGGATENMVDFSSMDYTQDNFSFLDDPGVFSGNFTAWEPDADMLSDMNYGAAANDWDYGFK